LNIQDNFLPEEEFVQIRDAITEFAFPWHFNHYIVTKDEDSSRTPGILTHTVYKYNVPRSEFYHELYYLMEQLEIYSLQRIIVNLNLRLSKPYISKFHEDIYSDPWKLKGLKETQRGKIAAWTTSIFYVNTNNGYTELEDGTRIESVANRLASFPLPTKHRIVTQTDTQTRTLINFNYLKRSV